MALKDGLVPAGALWLIPPEGGGAVSRRGLVEVLEDDSPFPIARFSAAATPVALLALG